MLSVRRAIVLGLVVFTAFAAVLFAPLLTYREVQSPDGAFSAIAKVPLFWSPIPMMPGQGGDKAGRVTIIRKDGVACGSASVETVSMIGDIRWNLDGKPREASIIATAVWNLDACSVKIFDR